MQKIFNQKQKRQLEQIKKWASENGNRMNYTTLLDMLWDEHSSFREDEEAMDPVIHELIRCGIRVEPLDEGEDYPVEGVEPDKFVPALINIKQPPMTVSLLMERLENEEIDLEPVFQRHRDLWDSTRQSQLVESLMLRIPIPSFYFDIANENEWKVIDGLQRLSAFQNYLVKKKKLTDLQYLTDFNGKTFEELPRQYIRRIKETPIVAFCVDKGTPERVVYNIFQRINTGGLKLEDQEIRNAMYQGTATDLARELAESEEFLAATGYAIKPDRMLDQEYIIRFLAFTELDYSTEYQDDIDSFLILAMKKVNQYSKEEVERVRQTFCRVMKYSRRLFGKYAFRKIGEGGRRGPINKALFELCAVCFSELTESQLTRLTRQKTNFMKKYEGLFRERKFQAALRSGKRSECIWRINRGRKFVEEFL